MSSPGPPDASRGEPGHTSLLLRPFFGRTPIEPHALRTLLLVSLGFFFETYDIGLISAALPQIAADLGIPAEGSGFYLGLIRFGGIGTIFFMALADAAGRRRIFLACLVAMSVGTFATALSQSALQFAAAQMLTRVFMLTAASLALVILVEEFPAELRGGAIGVMNVLGGIGFGLGAALYAAVDVLPFGWRALYAVGLGPIFLLPFLRGALRETRRFEAHLGQRRVPELGALLRGWLSPLRLLISTHPGRALAVGTAGLFSAAAFICFGQYTSWYVQQVHGWAPGQYSLLIFGGGLIAVMGNVVGGRGSDLFGRRRIGFLTLAAAPILIGVFYGLASSVPALVLSWGFASLCIVGGGVVIRTVATELFPTSHRSTAAGWLIFVETLGWTSGLFLVDWLTVTDDQLPRWIATVGAASAIAALGLLFLPETRNRELETLSDEAPAEAV